MWVTEEVSLVEFYKSGLSLAKEAGYDVVLCFIAREADASSAYDDIITAWQSIDDLTGPKVLFLFAGPSARADHESDNIYRDGSGHDNLGRLLFSPHVLMLHSKKLDSRQNDRSSGRSRHSAIPHYDLLQLKENTEDKHPLMRRESPRDEYILARHRPLRPRRKDITESQTFQIRELRDYLSLRESDIPCLHFTFLDGSPSMHHQVKPQDNIYTTLKGIVESIESDDMKHVKSEILRITKRLAALKQELQHLERKSISPQELFRNVILSLEQAATPGTEGQQLIGELILALQAHAKQPSEESRRTAFDRFRASRTPLTGRSDWRQVRSGVQRVIDIASYSDSTGRVQYSEENIRSLNDEKISARDRIERENRELKLLKDEHERKLEFMLSPCGIRERVSMAVSVSANAFLQAVVVVAARQELDAVRSYLDAVGAHRETYHLSESWSAERVKLRQGAKIEFVLVLAPGQGLEDMGDVLNLIQKEAKPKSVLLVGMMAGIIGKSKLLDVQAPRNIINGTRLGTRDGRIVPEPHGRDVDPVMHYRLQSLDRGRRKIDDIPLVTHKRSICVAAKFDDLTPELAQAALASDPENIVGIEMEGSALTARQATQRRSGEETGYIMIKGVADYAGAKALQEEIVQLRSALETSGAKDTDELLANPDPTTNMPLKSMLQRIATTRAMRVALALMEEGMK
jgi:hypothetical protein